MKNKVVMCQDSKTIKEVRASMTSGIVIKGFSGYFLIFCIVVVSYFLYRIIEPFFVVLLLATILATAFYPLYNRIYGAVKEKGNLASLITCFLIFALIIIPLFFFIIMLGKQSFDTYIYVSDYISAGHLDPFVKWGEGGFVYDVLGDLRKHIDGVIDVENIDVKGAITDGAKSVATYIAAQSGNLLKGFGFLLLKFFILLFAMFYLFKDGHKIMEKIMTLSPLPDRHEVELVRKFKEISLATLYGIFLTSLLQGIIGGVGFFIAGIPNALFWGTAISVFSLVPLFGTATIWGPASIFLLLGGEYFGGIFLLLWGIFVVGTVDNLLRAYLIGGRAKMNQLLTFLSVFGGIGLFGLIGVIFGPLILMLFFAFLHIYETEYDRVLHRNKGA